MKDKTTVCCSNCKFYVDGDLKTRTPADCRHLLGAVDCFGNYIEQGRLMYHHFETMHEAVCTCTNTGPRWETDETGNGTCPACLAFARKMFGHFPGHPKWHLMPGSIDRNTWGIRPDMIKTRNSEREKD